VFQPFLLGFLVEHCYTHPLGKGAGHLNLKFTARVFARRGQGTSGEAHASRS
jgi:hypothetical protein